MQYIITLDDPYPTGDESEEVQVTCTEADGPNTLRSLWERAVKDLTPGEAPAMIEIHCSG